MSSDHDADHEPPRPEPVDLMALARELRDKRNRGEIPSGTVIQIGGPTEVRFSSTTRVVSGAGAMDLGAIIENALGQVGLMGGALGGVLGGAGMVGAAGASAGVAAIRAHDPGFDPDAFLARAQACVLTVLEAWTAQRPDQSRTVMADGIWQQHRVQMEELVRNGHRNVVDQLSIASTTLSSAGCDGTADHAIVDAVVRSTDYDVDAAGKTVRGDHKVKDRHQRWHFSRPASATTRTAAPPTHCPNCGAPLGADVSGRCGYCHNILPTPQDDWLVSNIEQLGER